MNISKLTLTLLLCLSGSSVVASDRNPEQTSGSGAGSQSLQLIQTDGAGSAAAAAAVAASSGEVKRVAELSSNTGGRADKAKLFIRRLALRPSVLSAAITYAVRAAYNKSNFVESNNRVLGYILLGGASILLAVKKARRWLNNSDEVTNAVRPEAVTTADMNSGSSYSYSAGPTSLKRDPSMVHLASVGESAIGINSDLLEAAVGMGAGILAPMPSFLK